MPYQYDHRPDWQNGNLFQASSVAISIVSALPVARCFTWMVTRRTRMRMVEPIGVSAG